MKGEKGGVGGGGWQANANVHLEMEGRRRGCGVMHYRVSGSHSLRVSDDITVRWREEGRGEKVDVEFKYTSATNDEESFTSVLCVWGPMRVSTTHGHR